MAKSSAKAKPSGMSEEAAKHLAAVLLCPHQWSEPERRMVRQVEEGKKPKEYEADVYVCGRCGTNRVQRPGEATASMFPPQSRSEG